MLHVPGHWIGNSAQGLDRRGFLKAGTLSLLGLTLTDWFALQSQAAAPRAKAKSVILLWMAGGPPHNDTFDPKPESGEDYCGPLRKPIATNVTGIRIGELLPKLAKQADKYTLIRSMTHGNNGHETAAYIMLTGTSPSTDLAYPSLGSVVAFKKGYEAGYQGNLPPFITLTNPLGRFSETGFLGVKYKSFATGGDPNSKDFRVGGLVPPPGVTEQRLQERRTLLESIDNLARTAEKDKRFEQLDVFQDKAYGLLLGDARKAFDMGAESDATKDLYGRNRFGQSCLLARRLVEQGVPFVTINEGGWDTHKDHFNAMKNKLPVLDQGFAALLEDLSQRGLLESTIVVWAGEFGRTPKVAMEPPWNGGRHHFGQCFSCVVAGGGFKGGTVVGASDFRAEAVRSRPVYPWDLAASIYQLLGIDLKARLPHPQGCVAYVSPLASGHVQSGGILNEIMA
jgi:hypothetical protein